MLKALELMIEEIGPGFVSLKISPEMKLDNIHDETPEDTFAFPIDRLPW